MRGKVHKHVHASLQPFPTPARKFGHLHLDLVGPLFFAASREGHTHLLTVMDRATRWPEAFPLKACVDKLVDGWISRYGVPEDVTTDRGPQFTSEVWSLLCGRLGIRHHPMTIYHPQANRLVEPFHRQLKEVLRAWVAGADWLAHLLGVMLGLRSAPKEDTGISAAELVFGAPLTLPGEFLASPEASTQALVEQPLWYHSLISSSEQTAAGGHHSGGDSWASEGGLSCVCIEGCGCSNFVDQVPGPMPRSREAPKILQGGHGAISGGLRAIEAKPLCSRHSHPEGVGP